MICDLLRDMSALLFLFSSRHATGTGMASRAKERRGERGAERTHVAMAITANATSEASSTSTPNCSRIGILILILSVPDKCRSTRKKTNAGRAQGRTVRERARRARWATQAKRGALEALAGPARARGKARESAKARMVEFHSFAGRGGEAAGWRRSGWEMGMGK